MACADLSLPKFQERFSSEKACLDAIFDLTIADLKADNHNGFDARIMYVEALDCMKTAKRAGGNVKNLEDITRQVGRIFFGRPATYAKRRFVVCNPFLVSNLKPPLTVP